MTTEQEEIRQQALFDAGRAFKGIKRDVERIMDEARANLRERFRAILEHVRFHDWHFIVDFDGSRPYLQVQATDPCSVTGELHRWHGRKWFLSGHMTDSEVVQTAFLAVMTAVEHETREHFTYGGHAIFGPHYNVNRLARLLDEEASEALETRPDK